jgi:RHS repeat-associated protein
MESFYTKFISGRLLCITIILISLSQQKSFGQCSTPSPSSQSGCPGNYTLTVTSINTSVTSHRWYTALNGGTEISPSTNQSLSGTGWQSTYQNNFSSSVIYYVSAVCGGTETARVAVSFTNTSSTIAISSSSDPMAVPSGTSVTLTATSTGASYQWRYGNNTSGFIGIGSVNATRGGMYYASGNNNCGSFQSGSIQVNFLPVADAGPDITVITPITTCTIYGSASDQDGDAISSYGWTKVSGGAVTMTGISTRILGLSGLPTTSLPQTFVFRLTVTDVFGKTHFDDVNVVVTSSSNNNNYVFSETVKIPGQTTNAQVSALSVASKAINYEYADGLGRSLQSIESQASPTGNDLIQGYEYDQLQRQKTSYLPLQQNQTNGLLINNLFGNGNYSGSTHYDVYHNGIAGVQSDDKAYSAVSYESSPLSRVISQGSVGENFQPGQNDVDIAYGTNSVNDVRIWTISSNLPISSATWEANLLNQITTTNPQGVQSQEIANRQGLKLLTRTKIDATNWVETYYVYDDRNNLRFILPPELIRIIKTSGFRNPTLAEIDTWATQYMYDGEGRVVETKDPGKATLDWSYAVYDKRGRVVLTQDPEQRLDNEWSYTKYDELNRPAISGVYRPGSSITRSTMQSTIDNLGSGLGYQNISPQTTAGVKAAVDIVINAYEGINDYRAINSILIKPGFTFTAGVTAASFVARIDDGSAGTTADAFPTVNDEPLVITFYDDYKQCVICQDANFDFATETWVGTSNESYLKTDVVKDKVVAGSIKVLGSNGQWLHTVSYYNRNGQNIQTTSSDHLGGRQRTSFLVDFSGKTLESLTTYSNLNIPLSTVRRRFVYDNSDRLLKTYHRINSQPEVVLTAFVHNPVGLLIDKKIHSIDNGSTYLQSIDYRYNIRGDVLGINSTAGTDAGDPTDYFGLELATNNTFGALNTARYDGLVNGIKWRTDLPDAASKVKEKGYSFSYNNLGWLTGSTYKQNIYNDAASNWNQPQNTFFNEDGISYDYNGNIQQLSRKTKTSPLTSVVIDQLQYNYGSPTGNKLFSVADSAPATNKSKGFNDGVLAGNDYAYDVNGNVTMDNNKGIQTITYNFLNLPDRVTFTDNSYIQYLYDASGAKLRQTFYNSATPTPTTTKVDYVGGLQVLNDQLQFVFHEEGRVVLPDYNNLVPTPAREANGTEGYAANGTPQITSAAIGGQTYVKVLCTQSSSNPGVYPIGSSFYPVKAGESYSFKVLGYQSAGTNAKLYVWTNLGNLIWPGVALPQGSTNETWVTATFTVPAGATQVKLGVLWEGGGLNNTFYINRVALYKTDFEYQYFLTDQVGSPRVVLGTTPSTLTYTATMETESFSNETSTFLNLNSDKYEVNAAANATPGGNEALRMNNSYRVGPARSFKVFPGDVINATAQSYYTAGSGLTKATSANMIAALSAILSNGTQNIIDGITTAYNNPAGLPALALSPSQGATKPSAFINYILFDENYLPLEAKSQPIGSTAGSRQLVTLPQISVKEAGTVFIYLSYDNESTHPAYFDDFKITYIESPVIQINNNYAFGMTATEWVRDGEIDNNFLFQGKELNDQTGLHDFHARQYDGALGRWFVMDPAGQFASPYSGMGNNPVMGVDPDGRFWNLIIGAAIGGIMNWTSHGAQFDSDGLGHFLVGALAGAVSGGIGSGVNVAMAGGSFGAGFMGTAAGVSSTGFLAGAATGASAGLSNGLISGFGSSLVDGEGFRESLAVGARNGVKQGLVGGLGGGITGGIHAYTKNVNVITGKTNLNLTKGTGAHNVPSSLKNVVGKYVGKFEGTDVFETAELGTGYGSGGITLPGRGITVGKGVFSRSLDPQLMKHEFGHVLQVNQLGAKRFLRDVGLPSLNSASKHGVDGWSHSEFWTEVWANKLSNSYFEANYGFLSDPWNFARFPLTYKNPDDILEVIKVLKGGLRR